MAQLFRFDNYKILISIRFITQVLFTENIAILFFPGFLSAPWSVCRHICTNDFENTACFASQRKLIWTPFSFNDKPLIQFPYVTCTRPLSQ